MRFSWWYYACKLWIVPFAGVCTLFFVEDRSLWIQIPQVAGVVLLVALAMVGAVLGIIWRFRGLQMRCPFCKTKGTVFAPRYKGLRMECPKCGIIHGDGFLGLRLAQSKIPDNPSDKGPQA